MTLVIFVHVPKAAGTTLQRVIRDRYPRDRVRSFGNAVTAAEEELAATPREALDEIDVAMGHLDFGVDRYFGRPARYVTMLRHPVPRIASHYSYVRSTPRHYLHATVAERSIGLAEYARGELSDELRDGQVRMFSARARGLETADAESLEEAKRVLAEEVEVVGLTERFDESLLLMQDALGWTTPYYTAMNRGSDSSEPLTEEAVAAIEAANPLDLALYEFAAELVARRVDAEPGFAGRVERFRRRNRVLGPAVRVRGRLRRLR